VSRFDQKTLGEIKSLEPAERLEALHELWSSLPDEHKSPPLSEWETRLLDASIARSEAHPEEAVSWDELKQELRRRRSALTSPVCIPSAQ